MQNIKTHLRGLPSKRVLQMAILLVFGWVVAVCVLWGVEAYSLKGMHIPIAQVVANVVMLLGAVLIGRWFKIPPPLFGKGKQWLALSFAAAVAVLVFLGWDHGAIFTLSLGGLFVWTAISEEVVFRHYMYELIGTMTQRFSIQVMVNSLIFALFHLPVAVMTGYWWVLAISFAFGVFATVLRRLTSGIGWPFLAHWFVDIVSEL